MSRFKAKKRSFFKSGLALIGEKKVYHKTYFDQPVVVAVTPKQKFGWTAPKMIYDDIDNII